MNPHGSSRAASSTPFRTSAMHVTCSSSAMYASIAPGTAIALPHPRQRAERDGRRRHRPQPDARLRAAAAAPRPSPTPTPSTRPPAGVPRDRRPAPAGAMSAHMPLVCNPAAASDASASARIDSYDPAVTITCRCSLRPPQTTTAAWTPPQRFQPRPQSPDPTAAARRTTGRASRPGSAATAGRRPPRRCGTPSATVRFRLGSPSRLDHASAVPTAPRDSR